MANQVVIKMESKKEGLSFDYVSVELFSERFEMWEISREELERILAGQEVIVIDEKETYSFAIN